MEETTGEVAPKGQADLANSQAKKTATGPDSGENAANGGGRHRWGAARLISQVARQRQERTILFCLFLFFTK